MRSVSGCRQSIEEFEASAGRFGTLLGGVCLDEVDADGVNRFLAAVRGVEARVQSAVVQAGVRADELAADGAGAPARDALLGSGQVSGSTARREARRAKLASRSPLLGRAMASGSFGPDHLDSLLRRLGRFDEDRLTRIDLGAVLNGGADLPADTFDAMLRRAVEATEDAPGSDEAATARASSSARHWFNRRTGLGHLSAELDPERYEAMANALDQHTTALANTADGPVEKNANLAAEALVDLVCSSGERSQRAAHVTVVVDEDTLKEGRHTETVAETGDGHPLTDDAIARLLCDAMVQRVVLDAAGVPIDVGREHRTATSAQRTAMRALYSTCAWAGCDRPLSHCQAHHIHYWENGGRTDLHNLAPLCSEHHHMVHDEGWTLELMQDRRLRITRQDGTVQATTRQPTRKPPNPRPGTGPPPLDRHRYLKTA